MNNTYDVEKIVALVIVGLITIALLIVLVVDLTWRSDQMVPNLITTTLGVILGWAVHKLGGVLPGDTPLGSPPVTIDDKEKTSP